MAGVKLTGRFRKLRTDLSRRVLGPLRYRTEIAIASLGKTASRSGPIRVGLVSDGAEITSEEQFNPLAAFRSDLRRKLGVISLKCSLDDVLRSPQAHLAPFNIVLLKLSFRKNRSEALRTVEIIRTATRSPLIYFDGDDDLCIQWPELLSCVDLYIKKHVFRDRSQYCRPMVGKSNLTDYVHETFGVSFSHDPIAAHTDLVPTVQIPKIKAGYNLALDRKILDLYQATKPRSIFGTRRDVDIIFRGNVPNDWMGKLREPLRSALELMRNSHRVVTPDKRVTAQDYYQELTSSKICISPFGYGEICWRDFEAVLCGALLVKPDMSHVETNPDIYRPFETYVPVKWNFSDLEERCNYYLKHEDERLKITKAAFDALDGFYKNGGFVHSFAHILEQVSPSS